MSRRGPRRSLAPLCSSAILVAACSGQPGPPDPARLLEGVVTRTVDSLPRVDPVTPARETGFDPADVPHPDPAALDEPEVREPIEAARRLLESRLADGAATAGEVAGAFGRLGMLYHAYQFGDAAEACYRNAARLAPREFRWSYYLARLLQRSGRTEEALDAFERAVVLRADYVPALFWMGELRREGNRPDLARRLFEAALAHDPRSVAALVGLGRLDLAAGDPRRAAERFEAALALSPGTGAIHYALGMAYREQGDLERARGHLARSGPGQVAPPDEAMVEVLRLAGGRGTAHLRGFRALSLGRFELAAEEFRNLVADRPDDPGARVSLGLALEGLGDLVGAHYQFEQAVRAAPGHSQALFHLGRMDAIRGNPRAAASSLRAALRTDPGHRDAGIELAGALSALGDHDEAAWLLEQAVALDPGHGEARVRLAMARSRAGRHVEAFRGLEEAHALLPEHVGITVALARLLSAAPVEAVRDGARALRLLGDVAPGEPPALEPAVALAMAHAERGAFDEAARWQQRAVEAARRLEREDLLPDLERNLERYRRREPCREPWPG